MKKLVADLNKIPAEVLLTLFVSASGSDLDLTHDPSVNQNVETQRELLPAPLSFSLEWSHI